ncbi:MAG: HPF/RaiA family ribosome-associated protein [Bacillota bacterium]
MTLPVQITFHGVPASDALRAAVEKHAAKLERFSKRILGCHVVVEQAGKHHHKGNHYRLQVHLKVAGGDVMATHEPAPEHHSAADPYVVVRDAFKAVQRQLEDHERLLRGAVKQHVPPAHGRVTQIYKAADYGVIQTPEGREIHFHRHSVADDDFDSLVTGNEVRFTEVPGDEGPWASTVHTLGKHHPVG